MTHIDFLTINVWYKCLYKGFFVQRQLLKGPKNESCFFFSSWKITIVPHCSCICMSARGDPPICWGSSVKYRFTTHKLLCDQFEPHWSWRNLPYPFSTLYAMLKSVAQQKGEASLSARLCVCVCVHCIVWNCISCAKDCFWPIVALDCFLLEAAVFLTFVTWLVGFHHVTFVCTCGGKPPRFFFSSMMDNKCDVVGYSPPRHCCCCRIGQLARQYSPHMRRFSVQFQMLITKVICCLFTIFFFWINVCRSVYFLLTILPVCNMCQLGCRNSYSY